GNDEILAAPVDVHETLGIDMPQIAGGNPLRIPAGWVVQIAEHRVPGNVQLAIDEVQPKMRQRPPAGAGTICSGHVETDNRGALGKPVALIHRQAKGARLLDGGDGNTRAPDRDETQRWR